MSGNSPRSGHYIEIAKLADSMTEICLSTERGPVFAKLEEGRIVFFDWDGKQIGVVQGVLRS